RGALVPDGHHSTGSKLTSSLASTAKSLFFCGRARKRNSGFSVPPTGGSKINRVGGMWGDMGATRLKSGKVVTLCSELQPRTVPNNSYLARTRFILEATVNRLEE